jgi:hypothetical protein
MRPPPLKDLLSNDQFLNWHLAALINLLSGLCSPFEPQEVFVGRIALQGVECLTPVTLLYAGTRLSSFTLCWFLCRCFGQAVSLRGTLFAAGV